MEFEEYKSGFVALIGSPNVGKSTLMNAFVGQKITIVSPKAQTTRNKVIGILTTDDYQMIFMDTPGMHTPKNRLGEYMVKEAYSVKRDADVTVMLIDAKIGIKERDEGIIRDFIRYEGFIAAINKADIVSEKRIEELKAKLDDMGVKSVFVISALNGSGLDELLKEIESRLEQGPQYYPEDMVTDRPELFIAGELIREKALINLREEVPHGIGVEIEKINEFEDLTEVYAVIYCERQGHKGMIIGKGGAMLKKIGTEARADLEMMFGTKVFLKVFVKVKENWRNSAGMLKTLGYRE